MKSTVKLNAEAKDILCRIEKKLADLFCIDIRKHNIPVRLVGETVLLQAALEQKTRRNAHLLCSPVRAVTVKREVKLPILQGRLMHSTMEKKNYPEPCCFDRLEFDYKRKLGTGQDEFPASCARNRRTVFRFVRAGSACVIPISYMCQCLYCVSARMCVWTRARNVRACVFARMCVFAYLRFQL